MCKIFLEFCKIYVSQCIPVIDMNLDSVSHLHTTPFFPVLRYHINDNVIHQLSPVAYEFRQSLELTSHHA